jgi:hypothetical protein
MTMCGKVPRRYSRRWTSLNGQVLSECRPRHHHQEFLIFLRAIDANVPEDLDIHIVLDNCASHKHPKVKAWLARKPSYSVSGNSGARPLGVRRPGIHVATSVLLCAFQANPAGTLSVSSDCVPFTVSRSASYPFARPVRALVWWC